LVVFSGSKVATASSDLDFNFLFSGSLLVKTNQIEQRMALGVSLYEPVFAP